jgi:hypothetical protein
MMPKWLLFDNFVVAAIAYRGGRLVIPSILVVAGLCFFMASVGAARGAGLG